MALLHRATSVRGEFTVRSSSTSRLPTRRPSACRPRTTADATDAPLSGVSDAGHRLPPAAVRADRRRPPASWLLLVSCPVTRCPDGAAAEVRGHPRPSWSCSGATTAASSAATGRSRASRRRMRGARRPYEHLTVDLRPAAGLAHDCHDDHGAVCTRELARRIVAGRSTLGNPVRPAETAPRHGAHPPATVPVVCCARTWPSWTNASVAG